MRSFRLPSIGVLAGAVLASCLLSLALAAVPASAETMHSCVVKNDGTVWCWGFNVKAQAGADASRGVVAPPERVAGLDDAVDVDTGYFSTCALREQGRVSCWGGSEAGVLALDELGEDGSPPPGSATPRQIVDSDLFDAVDLSVGDYGACVVRADGRVVCWGCDNRGLSGAFTEGDCSPGDYRKSGLFYPAVVGGIEDAVAVSVGYTHACAVLEDGSAKCWGSDSNRNGVLGDGVDHDWSERVPPVPVAGLSGARAISTSRDHTCALTDAGTVFCWGNNWGGALGSALEGNSSLPVQVQGITDAETIEVINGRSCVVDTARAVICWGWLFPDAVGMPSSMSRVPAAVPGIADAVDFAGSDYSPCVTRVSGKVACWGLSYVGGRGDPVGDGVGLVGVGEDVIGVDDAAAVAVGSYNACMLRAAGAGVTCAGLGPFAEGLQEGEDGFDGLVIAQESWQIPWSAGASSLAVGHRIGCAVKAGSVQCIGRPDGDGSLGGGSDQNSLITPVTVTGLENPEAVSVGEDTACALEADQTVRCWGRVYVSGDGMTTVHSAEAVADLDDAVALTSGSGFSCALRSGGKVSCWGTNDYGQLGDSGVGSGSAAAVEVPDVTGAVQVVASESAACALRGDGTVICWGENTSELTGGQAPAAIAAVEGAEDISLAYGGLCFVRSGQVYCLGGEITWNVHVMRGDAYPWGGPGEPPDLSIPVQIPEIDNAVAVDLGGMIGCVLLSDGKARCFGYSYLGLGDGRAPEGHGPAVVPIDIASLSNVKTGLPPVQEEEPEEPPVDEMPELVPPVDDAPPAPDLPTRSLVLPPRADAPAQISTGKIVLTRFAVRRSGSSCPKRVSARITVGDRTRTLTTSRIKASGAYCVLTVSLALPRGASRAKAARFKVRGKGVKTRVIKVRRR